MENETWLIIYFVPRNNKFIHHPDCEDLEGGESEDSRGTGENIIEMSTAIFEANQSPRLPKYFQPPLLRLYVSRLCQFLCEQKKKAKVISIDVGMTGNPRKRNGLRFESFQERRQRLKVFARLKAKVQMTWSSSERGRSHRTSKSIKREKFSLQNFLITSRLIDLDFNFSRTCCISEE